MASDPHEIHNLAKDPKFKKQLQRHRRLLDNWIKETGDQGLKTESDPGLLAVLKRWDAKCVNPEYDRVPLPSNTLAGGLVLRCRGGV